MDKRILTLIISLFVTLLLVLTNPGLEDHKAAVKIKVSQLMRQTLKSGTEFQSSALAEGLGALMGNYVVDKLIDAGVSRDNYLLFSTTTFQHEGQSRTIGLGLLGNVFLSSKVDEALQVPSSEK